jgi:hypothetical protein
MNRPRWHDPNGQSPAFDFDFPPTPREEREEIDGFLRALRPEPISDATFRQVLGRAGIALAPERRPGRSAVREAFCLGLSAACLAIALLWSCMSPAGHNADHRPLTCPGGTFSR